MKSRSHLAWFLTGCSLKALLSIQESNVDAVFSSLGLKETFASKLCKLTFNCWVQELVFLASAMQSSPSHAGTRENSDESQGDPDSAHVPNLGSHQGPLYVNGVSSWEIAEQSASMVIPSCH